MSFGVVWKVPEILTELVQQKLAQLVGLAGCMFPKSNSYAQQTKRSEMQSTNFQLKLK